MTKHGPGWPDDGHYIQLNGGWRWYYGREEWSASMIPAAPIVEAMALINRYTGHSAGVPFDLVGHSLHVYEVVSQWGGTPAERWTAAGHDAHEAFVGDVSRPLKLAMRDVAWYGGTYAQSPYDVLEDAAARALAGRFGWQWPHPLIVKEADAMVLGWEADAIFGPGTATEWGLVPTKLERPASNKWRLIGLLEGRHLQ